MEHTRPAFMAFPLYVSYYLGDENMTDVTRARKNCTSVRTQEYHHSFLSQAQWKEVRNKVEGENMAVLAKGNREQNTHMALTVHKFV